MKRAGEGPLDPSFEVRDKERLLSVVYLTVGPCYRNRTDREAKFRVEPGRAFRARLNSIVSKIKPLSITNRPT